MSKGSRGAVYPIGSKSLEAGHHLEAVRSWRAEGSVFDWFGVVPASRIKGAKNAIVPAHHPVTLKRKAAQDGSTATTIMASPQHQRLHRSSLGASEAYHPVYDDSNESLLLSCVYLPQCGVYLGCGVRIREKKGIGRNRGQHTTNVPCHVGIMAAAFIREAFRFILAGP